MAAGQQHPYPARVPDPKQSTGGMLSLPSFWTDINGEPQNQQSPNYEGDGQEDLRIDFAQFELPLVEYARLHRLTSDYLSHNPLDSDLVPRPPADWQTDLDDPESTLNIGMLVTLGALHGHTAHEKLDIDKEAVERLAYAIELGQEDDSFHKWQGDCSTRFKDLKLEDPILLSDPQLDLMHLERRNMAVLSTDGMHSFADEEIKGPGFISPEMDAAMRDELKRDEIEKLDIERSTMEYLSEVWNMLSQDEHGDLELLSRHTKTRFPSPETPPLLPSSPSIQAFTPNVETAEMEYTSSPEDLIRHEAAKLERHILDQDNIAAQSLVGYSEQEDVDLSVYDFPGSLDESSSSPFPRKRVKNLKVEGPLTPEDSLEPPTKKAKTVSFSTELQTMIPNFESEFAMSEPASGDNDLTDFIESVLEPCRDSALNQIQEERLNEFDTTLRVAVPPIDDLALNIPWQNTSAEQVPENKLSSHRMLISQTKNELIEGENKWSGASKIERQLPWIPFPARLGEVNLEEEFDDGSLSRYLPELVTEDDIDVESLACTPQALKLLQENDDDDLVIEPHEFDSEENTQAESESHLAAPPPEAELRAIPNAPVNSEPSTSKQNGFDMQALLKIRKQELDTGHNRSRAFDSRPSNVGLVQTPLNSHQGIAANPTRFTDTSTTASALANFMRLHSRPLSTYEPANSLIELEHQQVPSAPDMDSFQGDVLPAEEQSISLASPAVTNITATFSIIVSSTVIADRDLMRELRKYLPGLEVVARELIPTNSRDAKQSVSNEADITTSPSTGILTMTLQKLKQRPLPGQTSFFGVRDRIALVSCRYSRLIVLVSEGRKQSNEVAHTTGPLDKHDLNAVSDLVGFASSLEHDVEVQFIAGGEPQLATWLAACILRTIIFDDNITLMQEESIWERLLRQAGLNPFAAQYVLSKLKPKEGFTGIETSSVSNISCTAKFGLAAFVEMTTSQRLEAFGQCIGRRVIEKVGEVVDGGFIPNPHRGVGRTKRPKQQ